MNIIVCVKQIQDPEIPPAKFKLDSEAKRVIPPEGIPPVMNPYDEQAVELALRLKEKYGGSITTLTIGDDTVKSTVKHALAMGADQGIILKDEVFKNSDSFGAAHILSQAIKKNGDYDLILCGRQAADWDEGLVGSIIAENLDLPLVTLAGSIEFVEGRLEIKRSILEGYQIFVVSAPAVVTVSDEVGRARLPSGMGIIQASQKQIPVWNADDIDADLSQLEGGTSRRKLIKLFIPHRSRECEMIEGETEAEAAEKLAERLMKAKVI